MAAERPPNILFVVVDQLYGGQAIPPGVPLPSRARLEDAGLSLPNYQVNTTVCTPSRSVIYTGRHAPNTGMWDLHNMPYITDMSSEIPTVGTMLREAGYHTAYKGKWHLSEQPDTGSRDSLEQYGFSEVQDWGAMWGAPLDGLTRDPSIAGEAAYWLRQRAPVIGEDQPWYLAVNFVNPHDIMYFQTGAEQHGVVGLFSAPDEVVYRAENAVELPDNFEDDLSGQPGAVSDYLHGLNAFFGAIPEGRDDLWKRHINYYVNCIRDVDQHVGTVLDALEASGQADRTIIIFTSDHGEMAGAHGLRQKGSVAFREVINVPFVIVHPDGPRGASSDAVVSAVDLVPTLLSFAGVPTSELRERHSGVVGRDFSDVIADASSAGPRGSAVEPGDGMLVTHDMLSTYDIEWITRNREGIVKLVGATKGDGDVDAKEILAAMDRPDFTKRNLFRAVYDGRHKMVRYFGGRGYNRPADADELCADNDVALYDVVADPGELRNLARPEDPAYDPALLERMNAKLNSHIDSEIGADVSVVDRLPEGLRKTIGSKRKE